MVREDEFATRMLADVTLMAILTGGVFKSGTVGRLGITRDSAAGAFDAGGYLRPCALVRDRALVPDGVVRDAIVRAVSTAQVVEVWLYEDTGFTAIDAALARLLTLFEGYQFTTGFPAEWVNTINRVRDEGALLGASMARMDFLIRSVEGG